MGLTNTMNETPSDQHIDLTIFVTCYNEHDLITRTLDTILSTMKEIDLKYEVLIFDDCSSDNSVEVVRQYLSDHHIEDQFELIANETNQGIGVNFFSAAERGRGKYFFVMHGDDAVHSDSMRAVLGLLGRADIIVPFFSTHLMDSIYNYDHRVFMRRLFSIWFTKLVQLISWRKLRYYNGPVLHLRSKVLTHRVEAFGLGYQAELLTWILNDPEVTFLEVRCHNYDRATGKPTAFKIKNIISVGASLLHILVRRLKRMK